MSLDKFDKTTVRENKDGERTFKVTLSKFDIQIHKNVKDRAYGDVTVEDVYSEAIRTLRMDYDSNRDITIMKAPDKGERVQVWLTEDADDDLRYLSQELHIKLKDVVFTAMVRFFDGKVAPGLP